MWLSFQRDWFLSVNHFARYTPLLHAPFEVYAKYGVALFAAALLLSWWLARRESPRVMAAALWAPVGTLVAVGLNQPLVGHFHEARPYTLFPHALLLVSRSQDFAFPSDHAVMAGAVAAGVLLAHRRLGTLTAVAAVLMAFTRVYVGVHLPLDVVVGLLFGAAVTTLGYLLFHRPIAALVARLSRTAIGPLLTRAHPVDAG
ncbi:phosphatase PAP2 family protein [Nocardioides sp. LS1]|uniref:phosphatase PAP2 family protein n=1 Tax=Nocardioides sp. LS1 TaxID=1027620 RepID=UPI0021AB188E|nr:phosphatase PAP2 family protein [Nocardioides sp. LS1]